MKTLDTLVPPPELCKLIPEGKFEDSALVWTQGVEDMFIDFRDARPEDEEGNLPAPTLPEIMEALYVEADGCCIHTSCYLDSRGWEACVVYECHDDSGYGGDHKELIDNNPATAALKLWLELERKKHEQQG